MLVELYARVEPSGWRISDRPGRDTRRARSWLGEDLDALEEFTQGYEGPLKVQAVGPVDAGRRAGAAERRGRARATRAPAATSPARSPRGCARTSPRCAAGCPAPQVVLQLDEPSLTAVLRGQVRTASGYRTHRAVDRQVVEGALRDVVGGRRTAPVVVHSCAPDVPFALLRRAGARRGLVRLLAAHRA